MKRIFRFNLLPQIQNRWSARSFRDESVAPDDILALIEAAHYAPSCFNEQPWRFLVADQSERKARLLSCLNENNQKWAHRAPVLLLILAQKSFAKEDRPNPWHAFDTGTAWGYLSLEAEKRGLIAHAMGGFDQEKTRLTFQIPTELAILTVVAIGRLGSIDQLSPALQAKEKPNIRRPIEDFLI